MNETHLQQLTLTLLTMNQTHSQLLILTVAHNEQNTLETLGITHNERNIRYSKLLPLTAAARTHYCSLRRNRPRFLYVRMARNVVDYSSLKDYNRTGVVYTMVVVATIPALRNIHVPRQTLRANTFDSLHGSDPRRAPGGKPHYLPR